MKIGIAVAIERELKAFLESEFRYETISYGNREVYHFTVRDNDVYAMMLGWGEIDAAASTQFMITKLGCEIILNFGVSGALERGPRVEDLFVVTGAVNHCFDVSPIDNVKPHQYAEFDDIQIPTDPDLVALVKRLDPTVKEAVVASGDRFVVLPEDKKALNELGCSICDMEIAAISRVCYLNGVRALSIKCISDTFDGDGSDFEQNVVRSGARAFSLLEKVLYEL